MSLQNVDVVRGTSRFIGLGNYLQLFQDGQFGLSVLNTAWYTLTGGSTYCRWKHRHRRFFARKQTGTIVSAGGLLYSVCSVTGRGRHFLEMALE